MSNDLMHHVLQAERLDDGVVITFDDGRSYLFKANLLYASRREAEDLTDVSDLPLD